VEKFIRQELEGSGFFGARFRESANRALLLPRAGFGNRTPFWLTRERAKELKDAVAQYSDFPMMLEAWRESLQDEMEIEVLKMLLDEVIEEKISCTQIETNAPSPFTSEVIWKRINELMYENDASDTGATNLSTDLIEEVAFSSDLRPHISSELASLLQQKLQRTFPGYAPRDADDLVEWVKERIAIPKCEWDELLKGMERDHDARRNELLKSIESRIVALEGRDNPVNMLICSVEDLHRIEQSLGRDPRSPILSPATDGLRATNSAIEALSKLKTKAASPHTDHTLESFLTDWLRFYGPLTPDWISHTLGVEKVSVQRALENLEDNRQVVMDELLLHSREKQACDARNLTYLLRYARSKAQPVFTPLPVENLPLFWAAWQGLLLLKTLQDALEHLFGYPAAASMWEQEILPARVVGYRTAALDSLLIDSDLEWFGVGKSSLTFALGADRELFVEGVALTDEDQKLLEQVFPNVSGRFTFADLLTHAKGVDSAELTRAIWHLAWRGIVSSSSFAGVRRGIVNGFRADSPSSQRTSKRRSARFGRSKWQRERPFAGDWYRLASIALPDDRLDLEELNKDRARVLLDRYGVLFRQLLERELPTLSWKGLFRTLRILELSGEIKGGYFFEGINGLQFISTKALETLWQGSPTDYIYWMNATDPASPCGLGLKGYALPNRVRTTHLVFEGTELVLVSQRTGKEIRIFKEPDEPDLPKYFGFISSMLTREAQPRRTVKIEQINGVPAAQSPYRAVLERLFDVVPDYSTLLVTKHY
jgi:ATP-dependent Lhr-like helicase